MESKSRKPSYRELEERVRLLEAQTREHQLIQAQLMEKQAELKTQNINLVRKSIELSDIKRELEDKYYELQSARKELKTQNIQLTRKSIDLSDVMRQLEDKNFDLQSIHSSLEEALSALSESEERYRRLVDSSLTGISITQDNMIMFCNPKYAEIFGYDSPEELVGKNIQDVVAQENWKLVERTIRLRQTGKEEMIRYECRAVKKDGSQIDVEVLGSTISYMDQPAVLGTLIDISERKKAETKRKELEEQLIQAQKLEAIGTLAGGIAHDFNNILAVIIGYTEILMLNFQKDDKTKRHLENIMISAERAKELVKQILTFSRKSEMRLTPVDVGKTVGEALALLRSSLPTTIEIRSHIENDIKEVLADATQVHQIIMNLCTNAAHAMGVDGGVLDVGVRSMEIEPSDFTAGYKQLTPGHYVELTVSDTGHGMEPAIMERIFEPYYTTKKIGEGTGLGLSVIHGIVKSYRGDITVYSEPGLGSTFHVFLPVMKEIITGLRVILPDTGSCGGDERILYVDDEEGIAEMSRLMLTNLGYTVTAFTDSTKALEYFRENADQFDLVITDQTMPGLTGRQLALEILNVKPGIPIILCSGFYESIYNGKKPLESYGIRAFIMKPFVRKEIASVIRDVLTM